MTEIEIMTAIRRIVADAETQIQDYEGVDIKQTPIDADIVRALKSMAYEKIREFVEGGTDA